jgi:16S rRNA (uracil1498-N3)-methyltransferase
MARRRFFVPAIHNDTAVLRGEEAHHLTHVLRAKTGQLYEISDNRSAYLAEIAAIGEREVLFHVRGPVASETPRADLRLYAALIKFDRFEWMVEKATELGVSVIVPVDARRSEKGLLTAAGKRVERWRRIAHESSQQSRRLRLPEVLEPSRLSVALADRSACRLFLDEGGGRPLSEAAQKQETAFAVGPEGGWTDSERTSFVEAGWEAVSLGPAVLRAETAAIAALAILSHACWVRATGL